MDDIFNAIFSPVGSDEFFGSYFERAPLHVPRNDAAYFADVFGVADVEDMLYLGATQRTKFALVRDGTALALDDYSVELRPVRSRRTSGRPVHAVDPRLVLAFFDRGYTLIINDAGALSPRLQSFCNRIQQRLGCYLLANVYFTPARAKAFTVHHDIHGTVVLQIEGSKVWRIYEPLVDLPVEAQPFSQAPPGSQLSRLCDVALDPGDTLYIPQGYPHEARAGERSLHVTVGITPPRVGDVLDAVVQLAILDDVELRRALPPGWQTSREFLSGLAQRSGGLLGSLLSPERVARVAEMLLGDLSCASASTPHGMFGALQRAATLQPETIVRLRDDAPHVVRPNGESVVLMVAERTFPLPASCGPILERLRGGLPFSELCTVFGPNEATDFVKFIALLGLLGADTDVAVPSLS